MDQKQPLTDTEKLKADTFQQEINSIIADNISTKRDGVSGNTPLHSQDALSHSDAIRRVLRHEILGHYGLNTLTPEDKADFLRRVLDSKDFPGIKSLFGIKYLTIVYIVKNQISTKQKSYSHTLQSVVKCLLGRRHGTNSASWL